MRVVAPVLPLVLAALSCSGGGSRSRGASPAEADAPASASVPRIWVLAVGVSEYQTAGLSLEFADRDASAIDAFFAGDEGGRVPDERRMLLVNQAATRAAVLTALTNLSRRTAPDDMIVLFLAMHGMPDAGGDLYYLSHDTDPNALVGTGLPQRDIEYAISRAAARRVVLLADACHAGAAGFDGFRGRRSAALAETNRLVGQLAESKPGTAVLTASSATEASAEGKKWGGGHGVFTYHLLAGLSGDADADGNGFVTIRELFDFTYRHVSKDTGGDQHPELKGRFDNSMPLAVLPGAGAARVAIASSADGARGVPLDSAEPLTTRETAANAAALEAACDKNKDADACAIAGGMMVRGDGMAFNQPHGFYLLDKACSAGSARGCCAIAVANYDPRDAAALPAGVKCGEACDAGSAVACRAIEAMRRAGGPRATDPKAGARSRLARELDDKACQRGDAAACHGLSELLLEEGDPASVDRARKLLGRACDAGLGRSCALAARSGGYGRGSQRLLDKGCEARNAQACASLAEVFFQSGGKAEDPGKAYAYQRRACDLGLVKSCVACADLAEGGRVSLGVNECLQRACDGNDGRSCMTLGGMYENGEGVPANSVVALGFYMRACAQGIRAACGRREAIERAPKN